MEGWKGGRASEQMASFSSLDVFAFTSLMHISKLSKNTVSGSATNPTEPGNIAKKIQRFAEVEKLYH